MKLKLTSSNSVLGKALSHTAEMKFKKLSRLELSLSTGAPSFLLSRRVLSPKKMSWILENWDWSSESVDLILEWSSPFLFLRASVG